MSSFLNHFSALGVYKAFKFGCPLLDLKSFVRELCVLCCIMCFVYVSYFPPLLLQIQVCLQCFCLVILCDRLCSFNFTLCLIGVACMSPCHAIVAMPLLIAFELLLYIYLESLYGTFLLSAFVLS